jgi:hypothetical protein
VRVSSDAGGTDHAVAGAAPGPTKGRQSEASMLLICVISPVWVEMMFFATFTSSAFFPESTSVFAISVAKLLFALWKIADAIAKEPVVPGFAVVEQTLSEMVLRMTATATRIFLGVCI